MSMKTIMRGLVVACAAALGLNAWAANVGDTVTWSNLATTQTDIQRAGAAQFKLCYQPQEGLPAGSTVTLSKIVIANRNDGDSISPCLKMTVGDTDYFTTAASTAEEVSPINAPTAGDPTTRKLTTYTFEDGQPTVEVGVAYDLLSVNADEAHAANVQGGASCIQNGTPVAATAGIWWNANVSTGNGWQVLCELTGKVASVVVPGTYTCTVSEGGEVWSPEKPETFESGATISITGGGTLEDALTFPRDAKVTMTGNITLAGATKFGFGSTLTIVSGTTTISNAQDGIAGHSDRGLMGNVIIEKDATLAITKGDSINYSGSTEMHVKGTLALGNSRQSCGPNNKLFVYVGGTITGAGDGEGVALDFVDANDGIGITFVDVDAVETKTVEIAANLRGNGDARNVKFTVPTGVAATITGTIKRGNVVKDGAGTLTLDAANAYTGTTTAAAGTLIATKNNSFGPNGQFETVKVLAGGNVTFNSAAYDDSRLNLEIAGTGVAEEGAVVMHGNGDINHIQFGSIKLTGDATISNDGTGGMLGSQHGATTIELNGHVLTKKGTGAFNLISTTIKDSSEAKTGSVVISEGSFAAPAAGSGNTIKVPVSGGTLAMASKPLTIDTDGRDFTISSVITGQPLTKIGEGTLTLSGSNTFTTLNVNEGTVKNGKTSGGDHSGLGAYSGATACDSLSLIKVAEDATLDVANIAGSGYGNCYRVELAGTITNSGAAMGDSARQLSKITLTGDNAKITGENNFALLCSGYKAAKLELNEHTLELAINDGKEFLLQTTTVSGTGTIKVTSGKLTFLDNRNGNSVLAEDSNVSFVLKGGQVYKANEGAWLNQFSTLTTGKKVVFEPNNYKEVDAGPTSWETITAEDLPATFAGADLDAVKTWTAKYAGEFSAEALAGLGVDAFLLDCAPANVDTEKAKFKIISVENVGGEWIVKVAGNVCEGEKYGNGYVVIESVKAELFPEAGDDADFFQATLQVTAPVAE